MHPLDFSNWHPLLDFSFLDIRTWSEPRYPPEWGEEGFIGPPTFEDDIMEGAIPNWWLLVIPIGYFIYKKYC